MHQEKATILGIRVDLMSVSELHQHIAKLIDTQQHALVLNVNINCINLSYKFTWLRKFLNQAEIVFCDGAGVVLGGRLLGYKIPERITYADWMWELIEFSSERGDGYFFLGAKPGIVEKAAENIQQKYPKINISGMHHGYFDMTPGCEENEMVLEKINDLKPNILVLGLGMPLQEKWLMENWDRLNVNIALTGGAVFDYLSGELQRAPRWMNDNGLEWLGRMLIEPRRLWRRYIIGNPLFLARIIRQRLGLLPFDS